MRLTSVISLAAILYSIIRVPVQSGFLYSGGLALLSLGTALIIVDFLLFPSRLSKIFEFRPLVWTGKISYGLYLWHYPVFEASRQALESRLNPLVYEVFRFGAVFVTAAISYYFLEKPFLKLKRRFSSTRVEETEISTQLLALKNP